MTLTDEMLLRYADGTLSAAEARAVEDQIEADQLAAERLKFLRASASALHSARDDDLADAPIDRARTLIGGGAQVTRKPDRVPSTVWGRAPTEDWWRPWRAAAGIVLFATGLILGRTFIPADETPGTPPPATATAGGWIDEVVDYHSLYSRATVESVNVYPDKLPEMEARLASALGASLTIPDLSEVDLEFREGKQLAYKGKTIIQLVYLPRKSGRPVALCAIKKPVDDFAPRYLNQRGMGIIQWARNGVEFLLVGEQPRAELETAAKAAIKRL